MSSNTITPHQSSPSTPDLYKPRRASLLSHSTNNPSSQQPTTVPSHSRTASFSAHKPLSLETRSVTNTSTISTNTITSTTNSPVTPRRIKRMSLSYIPSPTTTTSAKSSPSVATKVDSPQLVSLSRSASLSHPSSSSSPSSSPSPSPYPFPITSSSSAFEPTLSQKSTTDTTDDWLMDDDQHQAQAQSSRSMAERDSAKVEAQFHDIGYREGITAGKLSTLQAGFDQGFNEVGAPIGRLVGHLRGQVNALVTIINLHAEMQESQDPNPFDQHGLHQSVLPSAPSIHASHGQGRTALRGARAARARAGRLKSKPPAFAFLSHPALLSAHQELVRLQTQLKQLDLHQLADPDYEALEHEREHSDEVGPLHRETSDETRARKQILPALKQRLQNVYDMLGIDLA